MTLKKKETHADFREELNRKSRNNKHKKKSQIQGNRSHLNRTQAGLKKYTDINHYKIINYQTEL